MKKNNLSYNSRKKKKRTPRTTWTMGNSFTGKFVIRTSAYPVKVTPDFTPLLVRRVEVITHERSSRKDNPCGMFCTRNSGDLGGQYPHEVSPPTDPWLYVTRGVPKVRIKCVSQRNSTEVYRDFVQNNQGKTFTQLTPSLFPILILVS